MRSVFLFPLLISTLMMACQAQKTEADFRQMLDDLYKKTVPLLSTAEVRDALDTYLILDTREEEEYEVSHLPGAVWVGYDDFQEEKIKALAKDQPILVYCSVGYRSERIGEKLQEMGFKRVNNLYGGIFDWANQGEGVVDVNGQATSRIHTYNQKWGKWLFKGEKVY